MKPRASKNFREAKVCDKIARRSAGLDKVEVVQQTLIQLNEQIEGFDCEPLEATVLDNPTP
jgi:hypothetical protein